MYNWFIIVRLVFSDNCLQLDDVTNVKYTLNLLFFTKGNNKYYSIYHKNFPNKKKSLLLKCCVYVFSNVIRFPLRFFFVLLFFVLLYFI